MGGGGSNKAANRANAMAAQQAAEARQKEIDRQIRLQQGYDQIKGIYEGTPTYTAGDKKLDWSTIMANATAGGNSYGVPAGYTLVTPGGGKFSATGSTSNNFALKGPDGKLYKYGSDLTYSDPQANSTRTGGFDDSFYTGIKNSVTDLGNIDINDQWNKARENLQYALARAGLTTSSAGNQGQADIEKAKAKAGTDLAQQASDTSSKVRDNVTAAKNNAVSQLYATENPTLAANTATSGYQNIMANKPGYNSLGDIFGAVVDAFGKSVGAARSQGYFGAAGSPTANSANG